MKKLNILVKPHTINNNTVCQFLMLFIKVLNSSSVSGNIRGRQDSEDLSKEIDISVEYAEDLPASAPEDVAFSFAIGYNTTPSHFIPVNSENDINNFEQDYKGIISFLVQK